MILLIRSIYVCVIVHDVNEEEVCKGLVLGLDGFWAVLLLHWGAA
jgi:hypothetical protein